ncbi:hypothetical protein KSS87_021828, partial [Heliosperma pusillum]
KTKFLAGYSKNSNPKYLQPLAVSRRSYSRVSSLSPQLIFNR